MKNILGLRTCIYRVPDLAQAKSWYTKAINTEPYFDEAFYVGFNIGGYELGLLPLEDGKAPKSEIKPDNVMCYWGVNDIESEYKSFLNQGATSHEPPTNVGGELKVASVRDPWNNVIGLIYNPHFKLPE